MSRNIPYNGEPTTSWFCVYTSSITKVPVVRFTDANVWIKIIRHGGSPVLMQKARSSSYECYFPTFAEAKAYIVDSAEKHVVSTARQIVALTAMLENGKVRVAKYKELTEANVVDTEKLPELPQKLSELL